MKRWTRVLTIIAVLTIFCTSAVAQHSKGLRGSVIDRDGNPSVGIKVTFVDLDNPKNTFETETNEEGNFLYGGLPYTTNGYKVTVQVGDLPPVTKVKKPKLMSMERIDFDMREDIKFEEVQEAKASYAADAKDLFELGDYEGALENIELALADKDESEEANIKAMKMYKAVTLVKLERWDDALAACEDFNGSYPGNSDILGQMVVIYEKKGDKEKAAEYSKLFKDSGGKVLGDAFNKGAAAMNEGDMAAAVTFLLEAVEEDPKDAEAHYQLGVALARSGRHGEAVDHLKKYKELDPSVAAHPEVDAVIDYAAGQM